MTDKISPQPIRTGDLRQHTTARVSLGRTGPSLPTHEHLRFQLDHALARDAVHTRLDQTTLLQSLHERSLSTLTLQSNAPDRATYLRRPDLGRTLHPGSRRLLTEHASTAEPPQAAIILADGLSALALERHSIPTLDAILRALHQTKEPWTLAPICISTQARVAIDDEIGLLLRAGLTILLIGERPGLSAPDSLGIYLTWNPQPGRTDAERNCISNIRHEGLSYASAADQAVFYMNAARRLQATGIALKAGTPIHLPVSGT